MAARPGAENHTRTAQPPEPKEAPPALFILFYAVIVQLSQLEAST